MPPPLPEEVAAADAAYDDAWQPSLAARIFRDLRIAAVCLLAGWLFAQPTVLKQFSMLEGIWSVSPQDDIAASNASIVVAQPSQLIEPTLGIETPSAYASLPLQVDNQPYQAPQEQPSVTSVARASSPPSDGSSEPSEAAALPSEPAVKLASAERPPKPAVVDVAPPKPEINAMLDLTLSASKGNGPAQCADGTCPSESESLENHGTRLAWAESPADAYRMAVEKEKLVFMIHVSGNFEIPGFT